jgi:hypothetical protein
VKEAGVRGEKRLGAVGLGLFFLFPLVGLFQLGDADEAWRQVAKRARSSVLSVHQMGSREGEASTATACVVVLADAPLRAVIAGTSQTSGLRSPTRVGWIAWKPIYSDPRGSFTLLEASEPLPAATPRAAGFAPASPRASGVVPLATSSMAEVRAADEDPQPVPAVLVSPAPLDELPLWVGVLESDHDSAGRAIYRGTRLRELAALGDQAGTAHASSANIHPALLGAPFVTREGVVVALYIGNEAGTPRAVPMGLVRQALASLGQRTTH